MSNEKALLQEAWRTAYTSPNGFPIPCPDARQAASLRFALYSATKQFRNDKGDPDEVLRNALNNCAITITPDHTVLIQRKLASRTSQTILAALGQAPKTVEEYKIGESLSRVLGKLEQPATEPVEPISEAASKYGARNR